MYQEHLREVNITEDGTKFYSIDAPFLIELAPEETSYTVCLIDMVADKGIQKFIFHKSESKAWKRHAYAIISQQSYLFEHLGIEHNIFLNIEQDSDEFGKIDFSKPFLTDDDRKNIIKKQLNSLG